MNRRLVASSPVLLALSLSFGCGTQAKTPVDFRSGSETGGSSSGGSSGDTNGILFDFGGQEDTGGDETGDGDVPPNHQCLCPYADTFGDIQPGGDCEPMSGGTIKVLITAGCLQAYETQVACEEQKGCVYMEYDCSCGPDNKYVCPPKQIHIPGFTPPRRRADPRTLPGRGHV